MFDLVNFVKALCKRTGPEVGPGRYLAEKNKTITSSVNRSHHAVNIPLMGKPYPKETTYGGFKNLILYDPTFASEKHKRENRNLVAQKMIKEKT